MQTTTNNRFFNWPFCSNDAIDITSTNIQFDIPFHFATTCTFNIRGRITFIIINQCCITTNMDILYISIITTTSITCHTAGIQIVTILHLNVSRDFQISITLYRTLIRSSNHIMQTATRRRINIPISSNNYMRTIYCSLISTSIKCGT